MPVDKSRFHDMVKDLRDAQFADHDNRLKVREADHFINKRDGQWEPQIISRFGKKPRYTFDECNPIVDDIMGEMEASEFGIQVTPGGNSATKDDAQIYDGIIRTIEMISGARFIYNQAARNMVGGGMDGWRVVQAYRDDDTFQQDLLIKKVHNFVDSVWYDPGAVERTREDADWCFVLTSMTKADYEKQFPKGSGQSIGADLVRQVYNYKKPHEITVGEYIYRKPISRELALLSDGRILEVNEEFEQVRDELHAARITVLQTKKRVNHEVYIQLFDGSDFLKPAQKTVFNLLPIIPVYGNFKISENKTIYWGIVEKLMDPQRIINYSESRKIEEGALSPRGKYWATKEQAASGDIRRTMRTMNTNTDPVQFYDHVEGQPPPFWQGAPQSNPGLIETTQSARSFVERTSGTFDEARGAAPAHRSGEAVQLLQQKSDNPKRKWFTAMEIGIGHTCKILVKAIPKVYDTQQEMVLTGQNGQTSSITIRQKVRDVQTGDVVELHDLSKGVYEVTCRVGPAFQSRQQETVASIIEMSKIDPSIMQLGSDILLGNISAPGIDQLHERKRLLMVMQGLIPQSQLTEDEKQLLAQQQQGQSEMSPLDQANLMVAQAQLQDAQGKNQERQVKFQLEQQKVALKEMELQMKSQIEQQKLAQAQQKQSVDLMMSVVDQLKVQAETLKFIREAIGADGIVDPAAVRAFSEQSQELLADIRTQ